MFAFAKSNRRDYTAEDWRQKEVKIGRPIWSSGDGLSKR